MKNKKAFIIEAICFALIITLDLLTKYYISDFLLKQPNHTYVLINNVLEFKYSENTGASFGIFQGHTTGLIVFTSIAMAILFVYWIYARKEHVAFRISLFFILAGGIGNLVDRISLSYVRDFIYFKPTDFPIFNFADSFVTIGAIIMIIYLIVSLIKEYKNKGKKEQIKND